MRKPVTKKTIVKISLISMLTIGITILHYRTGHLDIPSHILFRELYFLPIVLAGFWFGTLGAVSVSLAVSLLYLPYIFSQPEGITGHNLGNIVQVILFNSIGLVVGWLRNREKGQQRKLLEAENLAAMGRAVSCIAHDMKTPLMAIGGFVQQVRRKVEDQGLAKKLDMAGDQVRRLEILVGDMLAFAKPLQLQYSKGTASELIEEVVVLAGEKARMREVRLLTEVPGDMPPMDYDPHRLLQAMLNLVNNALEASPQGGEVTIRCHCGQGEVFFEVIDQGDGVPDERRPDIFKPFVSSKKDGTGLGLSIVKKVIEAHSGSIAVFRNGDRGAIFRISLPSERALQG